AYMSSYYRWLVIAPILMLSFSILSAQSDTSSWFNRILTRLTKDDRPPERPRFLAYPTFGYSPETSFEFGVASSLLFHARNDYQHNRLSEVTAFGFFTLRSQFGLWLDNAVYTDRDGWLLLGKARFQHFPLLYFGIGADAPEADPVVVDGNYSLVRQRVLRRVSNNFFAGLQLDVQHLARVDFGGDQPTRALPVGADGSTNVGVGPSLVYDSRPNMLNTREGWFAELSWLHYGQALGSDYAFEVFSAELRRYHQLNAGSVFAWQLSGNAVQGNAPFNMLSLMGNEMLMRGYYTGRFRDRQYYAAQAEYRWLPFPFSRRLGGAAFLSAGAVSPSLGMLSTRQVRLAGGAGLRFLIFPKKDIFVRLDAGFTREGVGFYIFTGEAF
ncbi:MAG: outer membrane protein assembly factor, partial [Saprospiraceae bacterium]|nr:outer membrane protein assembly factor [Saprospiraceae bacterium]